MAKGKYYKELKLGKNASKEDVKKAYRELAKKYHPDVNKDTDANQRFIAVRRAYEIINNIDNEKLSTYICNHCGEIIEVPRIAGESAKERLVNKNTWLLFVVGLQVIGILVLVYFCLSLLNNQNQSRYEALLKERNELQEVNLTFQRKVAEFNEIADFVNSSDAGRASPNFFASDYVVILQNPIQEKILTVTANFVRPYDLLWTYDESLIKISSASNWDKSKLSLVITPVKNGINYITFSNTRNSQKFRVLVIVTD